MRKISKLVITLALFVPAVTADAQQNVDPSSSTVYRIDRIDCPIKRTPTREGGPPTTCGHPLGSNDALVPKADRGVLGDPGRDIEHGVHDIGKGFQKNIFRW